MHREGYHQDIADQEFRDGHGDKGGDVDQTIEYAVPSDRGHGAQDHGKRHRYAGDEARQEKAVRKAEGYDVDDRTVVDERIAKIANEDAAEPPPITNDRTVVEMQLISVSPLWRPAWHPVRVWRSQRRPAELRSPGNQQGDTEDRQDGQDERVAQGATAILPRPTRCGAARRKGASRRAALCHRQNDGRCYANHQRVDIFAPSNSRSPATLPNASLLLAAWM